MYFNHFVPSCPFLYHHSSARCLPLCPPSLAALARRMSACSQVAPTVALRLYREMHQLRACCTLEQQIIEAQGPPLETQDPPLGASAASASYLLVLRQAAANTGWLVCGPIVSAGLPLSGLVTLEVS